MKVTQEMNTSSSEAITAHSSQLSSSETLQGALVVRSSRSKRSGRENANLSSVDEELDAVVSAKFFGAVADGFSSMGNTLASAGMSVGSAIGNAAMVVGNTVVKAAETSFDRLPGPIQDAANAIGNEALGVINTAIDVGEMVADATIDLAGTALEHAQRSVQEGARLSSAVGNFIADKAAALGGEIVKLGPLAAGLASAAWNEIKKFVNCLGEMLSLCTVLIGDQCDCEGGSYVDVSPDKFSVRCIFKAAADFSKAFGVRAVPTKNLGTAGEMMEGPADENGKKSRSVAILPGEEYEVFKSAHDGFTSGKDQVDKAFRGKNSSATSGSCEASLNVALEGEVQFSPDVTMTVHTSGTTEFAISGTVRAAIHALVTAEGSCSFNAMRGFPDPPKKKVVCAGPFCLVILLQMMAELNLEGTLTGTIEASSEVDFGVEGTVKVTKSGHAEVDVKSPSIGHQNGFAIGASASASLLLSVGPVLTLWPLPGIPITFRRFPGGSGTLLQESTHVSTASGSNSTYTPLEMCGAAALNTFVDVDITGFALPAVYLKLFDSAFITNAIQKGVMAGARAMIKIMTGPMQCVPGASFVTDKIMEAAEAAATAIVGLIPALDLDFNLPSIQLLPPMKLFCHEVYKTPGFDSAPCAAELGCKHTGRKPPSGDEIPPPEQVSTTEHKISAGACPRLVMGDRFIQLGDSWRLADVDGTHFVLAHKDGQIPIVWRSDGHPFWRPWPTTAPISRIAWDRQKGPPRGISFGFQFIQIGNFRIGANDDDHFSVSHKSRTAAQTWRGHDASVHHRTNEWELFDRGEGFQAGVTFGDKFIQVGKMRFGEADSNHFLFSYTETGRSMEIFRGNDGTRHPGSQHWDNQAMVRKAPADWTCPDIAELAFGECKPEFGHWGDRFIQLGKWRMAAIDGNHFSISHQNGKTAQVYKGDGHLMSGPLSDFGAWDRSIGFPHGITFGANFIQIGRFRIAATDENHMSISHQSGTTAQIFRGHDGTLHPGPRHDFNAWTSRAGPASGVTFGDQFIQLGEWRFGADDTALYVTHKGYNTSPEMFHRDGHVIPRIQHPNYFHGVTSVTQRYAQWHCGGIQEILGSCPGFTAGHGFLQIGSWRVAEMDSDHFSFSHSGTYTPAIYTSDGHVHSGPRHDQNSWDREPRETSTIKFGDRFIQFGEWWRLGEWEENGKHLVVSRRDSKAPMIWREDGIAQAGPHDGFNLFERAVGAPSGIAFGHGFVQLGHWRIGDVDGRHFSIAHVKGKTAEILSAIDGKRYLGPREDFTTFGRMITDCRAV